jgi:hypothetical protein
MRIIYIVVAVIGALLMIDGSWYFVNNIDRIFGNPGSVGMAHTWYYDIARIFRSRPVDGTIVFVSIVVATTGVILCLSGVLLYMFSCRDRKCD